MPYIDAKLSISIDDKDKLQEKLSAMVSACFSKPTSYIMSSIQENASLWMGNKKLEKGAYLSISLLGSTTKQACALLSKQICDMLVSDYSLNSSNVYITYHPVELWSFMGSMF